MQSGIQALTCYLVVVSGISNDGQQPCFSVPVRVETVERPEGSLVCVLNDIFGIVLIPGHPSRKVVGCVEMRKNRALETRDLVVVQSSHNLHPDFNDGL